MCHFELSLISSKRGFAFLQSPDAYETEGGSEGWGLSEGCLALCASSRHTDELLAARTGEQRRVSVVVVHGAEEVKQGNESREQRGGLHNKRSSLFWSVSYFQLQLEINMHEVKPGVSYTWEGEAEERDEDEPLNTLWCL